MRGEAFCGVMSAETDTQTNTRTDRQIEEKHTDAK